MRRFDNQFKIETSRLKELVNLARMSPSAANKQPLKYIISRDDAVNKKIFPAWDGQPT